MSESAKSFVLVATLAEDETITVNELAAHMEADSRFARMVLMQAYAEGLVRLDDRCSRWIRNDGSYEVEVIRN
jgi:hypothetical protein